MLHVCSRADSMDRGEWYQEWQTGEPVAPGGLCQGEGLLSTTGHQDGWVNERGEGCHQVPLGLAGRGLGHQRGWKEPAIAAEMKCIFPAFPSSSVLFQISACSCWM